MPGPGETEYVHDALGGAFDKRHLDITAVLLIPGAREAVEPAVARTGAGAWPARVLFRQEDKGGLDSTGGDDSRYRQRKATCSIGSGE